MRNVLGGAVDSSTDNKVVQPVIYHNNAHFDETFYSFFFLFPCFVEKLGKVCLFVCFSFRDRDDSSSFGMIIIDTVGLIVKH